MINIGKAAKARNFKSFSIKLLPGISSTETSETIGRGGRGTVGSLTTRVKKLIKKLYIKNYYNICKYFCVCVEWLFLMMYGYKLLNH